MVTRCCQLSGQRLSDRLNDDPGGFRYLRQVRMLRGFYRNPWAGVKPDYPGFLNLSKKVINKMYLYEFIEDNMEFNLMVLKPTVYPTQNFFKDFK